MTNRIPRKRWRHWRSVAAVATASATAVALLGSGGASAATSAGSPKASTGSGSVAVGTVGAPSQFVSMKSVCKGKKSLTVGYAEGFDDNAWRKIAIQEFKDEAAQCPLIKKLIFTNANLSTEQAISDINDLVAQGANIILVYPDAGSALIPAMRKATEAGVTVIPWATGTSFGGTAGVDYYKLVTELPEYNGRVWAQWMVNALHEHGNILFLGGTAGNPTSQAEFQGAKDVIKKYHGMHWLIDSPVTTGWDPETEQQVMSGLLTKYHNINGIITDYGGSATGAINAFVQAGRKLVPMTANDYNQFSCDYDSLHKTNPDFQIGTVSSRTWIVRDALRQGVAAQEGTKDPEPNLLELPLIENSLVGGKLAPKCDKSLPPDAILSSELTSTQLAKLFGK